MFDGFLQQIYFHNRVIDYITALAVFFFTILIITILKNFLIDILRTFARKRSTTIDIRFVDAFQNRIKPFINLLYFGAFFFGLNQLNIPEILDRYINILIISLLIFYAVKFIISILSYFLKNYWIKKESDSTRITAIRGIETFLKIIIWSIALIILLDNLGIQISPLVAGFGIGGIAIALAAQNILGDLFGYFIIFFDHPFEIGDFIIIDD